MTPSGVLISADDTTGGPAPPGVVTPPGVNGDRFLAPPAEAQKGEGAPAAAVAAALRPKVGVGVIAPPAGVGGGAREPAPKGGKG